MGFRGINEAPAVVPAAEQRGPSAEARQAAATAAYEKAMAARVAGDEAVADGVLREMRAELRTEESRALESNVIVQLRFLASRNLAEIAAKGGRPEEALAFSLEACEIDPNDGPLWRRTAALAEEAAQPHVARHCYENACLCTGGSSWLVLEGLCRTAAAVGDVAAARAALAKLRRMNPRHPAPVDLDALEGGAEAAFEALAKTHSARPAKRAKTKHAEPIAPATPTHVRETVPEVFVGVCTASWAALAQAMVEQLRGASAGQDGASVIALRLTGDDVAARPGEGGSKPGGSVPSGAAGDAAPGAAGEAVPAGDALGATGTGADAQDMDCDSAPKERQASDARAPTAQEKEKGKGKGKKAKSKPEPSRKSSRVRDREVREAEEAKEIAKAAAVPVTVETAKETLASFIPEEAVDAETGSAPEDTPAEAGSDAAEPASASDAAAQIRPQEHDAASVKSCIEALNENKCCSAVAAARVLKSALADGAAHESATAAVLAELALALDRVGGAGAGGFSWDTEELIALGECHIAAVRAIKDEQIMEEIAFDEEDQDEDDEDQRAEDRSEKWAAKEKAHVSKASESVAAAVASMLAHHDAAGSGPSDEGVDTLPVSMFGVPATHTAAAALHWLCGRAAMHESNFNFGVMHLKECAKLLFGEGGELPDESVASLGGCGPRPEVVRQYLSKLEIRQVLQNSEELLKNGQERAMLEDLGPFLRAEGSKSRLFSNVFTTDEETQMLWIAIKAFESLSGVTKNAETEGDGDTGLDNLFGDRSLLLELVTLDGLLTRVSREASKKAKRRSVSLSHPNMPSLGEVLRAVSESARRAVALVAENGGERAAARVAAVPLKVVRDLMVRVMDAIDARMAEGANTIKKKRARAINLGTDATALSDASLAFSSLAALALEVQDTSLAEASRRETRLLLMLQELLTNSGGGAIKSRNAAFLRHMLGRLVQRKGALSKRLQALEAAAESRKTRRSQKIEPEDAIEVVTEVEEVVDAALAKCLKPLYGVTLDTSVEVLRDKENLVTKDMKLEDINIATRREAADLFQHFVVPTAKSAPPGRMYRLAIVMKAVRHHFDTVVADYSSLFDFDTFLDAEGVDEVELGADMLPRITGSEPIAESVTLNFPRAWDARGVSDARAEDPNAGTHSTLHWLCFNAEDPIQNSEVAQVMHDRHDEDFVKPLSDMLKSDLLFNSERILGWLSLAKVYDDALDLILNDAAKVMDCASWERDGADEWFPDGYFMRERVATFRRRSRRCLLRALAMIKATGSTEPGMDMATVAEYLGLASYDMLQRVPPVHDMLGPLPGKGEAAYVATVRFALAAFDIASNNPPIVDEEYLKRIAPDRRGIDQGWLWRYYCGKLHSKLGEHTEALDAIAKAARMAPGIVEPFYTMHATRLKMLERAAEDGDDAKLRAVAKIAAEYCCEQSACRGVKAKDLARRMHADGIAAMAKVWSFSKWFHKAAYRLALARLSPLSVPDPTSEAAVSGAIEAGIDDLVSLFVVRGYTGINMWEITEGSIFSGAAGGRKKRAEHRREVYEQAARNSSGAGEAEGATASKRSDDGSPGAAPWSAAHPLLLILRGESSRKFIGCLRKCIALYVRLLAERGAEGHMQSLQTLEKLISVISSKGDYYNVLTDMTAMLKGAYGAALARALDATEGSDDHDAIDAMAFEFYWSCVKGERGADALGSALAAAKRLFAATSFGMLAARADRWEPALACASIAPPTEPPLVRPAAAGQLASAPTSEAGASADEAQPEVADVAAPAGAPRAAGDASQADAADGSDRPGDDAKDEFFDASERLEGEAQVAGGGGSDGGAASAREDAQGKQQGGARDSPAEHLEGHADEVEREDPEGDSSGGWSVESSFLQATQRHICALPAADEPGKRWMLKRLDLISQVMRDVSARYPSPRLRTRPVRALMGTLGDTVASMAREVFEEMCAIVREKGRYPAREDALAEFESALQALGAVYYIRERLGAEGDRLTELALEVTGFVEPKVSVESAIKLAERAKGHAGVFHIIKAFKNRLAKEARAAEAAKAVAEAKAAEAAKACEAAKEEADKACEVAQEEAAKQEAMNAAVIGAVAAAAAGAAEVNASEPAPADEKDVQDAPAPMDTDATTDE